MIKYTVLVIALVGAFDENAAQLNPVCSKLPNLKGLNGNSTCCDFPSLLEEKSMDQCWNEVKNSKDSDMIRQCKSLECIFKKNNAMSNDGTLDKAGLEKYLDMQLKGSDEWLKIIKPLAVDQCLGMLEKDYSKMIDFFKTNKMEIPESSQCAMKPMLMSICVMAKGFAHCPEKDWKKNPTCDEWKKYLGSCTDTIDNTLEFYKQLDQEQ